MKLEVRHLGPITEGSLRFGDLTVLVGPQASGKSIALQLLKLVVDTGTVQAELRRYGLDWNGQAAELLDAYFGEGMRGIWSAKGTKVRWNGADIDIEAIARRSRKDIVCACRRIPHRSSRWHGH
jgi:predicted ATPase